jgi:hypothetical protein
MVSSVASFDIRLGFAPLVPASRTPLVALPGAFFERPMVVDGEIKICKVMQMGCTFDHRCFDGYQIGMIARFIRNSIENPYDYFAHPSTYAKSGRVDDSSDDMEPALERDEAPAEV